MFLFTLSEHVWTWKLDCILLYRLVKGKFYGKTTVLICCSHQSLNQTCSLKPIQRSIHFYPPHRGYNFHTCVHMSQCVNMAPIYTGSACQLLWYYRPQTFQHRQFVNMRMPKTMLLVNPKRAYIYIYTYVYTYNNICIYIYIVLYI